LTDVTPPPSGAEALKTDPTLDPPKKPAPIQIESVEALCYNRSHRAYRKDED